mmetsp:Transcript_8505/g.21961  ORF Transcript_8505/g.21961 Transcript_8505/m.21961 type:complete len:104 (-) Transcript_8505:560-871(-)
MLPCKRVRIHERPGGMVTNGGKRAAVAQHKAIGDDWRQWSGVLYMVNPRRQGGWMETRHEDLDQACVRTRSSNAAADHRGGATGTVTSMGTTWAAIGMYAGCM